MDQDKKATKKNGTQYAINLTLAAVASQVGCLTLFVVLAALFGGLWLDSHFQTRPMFTVGLMIASVPVTLVAMFWIVKKATSHLEPAAKQGNKNGQEDVNRGKTS